VKTKGKLFISTPTTNFHYQKKENKFHRNKENEAIHEPQRIRIKYIYAMSQRIYKILHQGLLLCCYLAS
jgi:hypothetical protein